MADLRIDQHRRPPCICGVSVAAARAGAKHATACGRHGETHVVDVERADHLAGRGWSTAWLSSCSCGARSAGAWRTPRQARRELEDTRP